MKLTKREIDNAAPKGERPWCLWEASLAGFGVRILPSGTKRFIVKYRTHGGGRSAAQRWMTLGTVGQLSLDQARKQAQQVLAAVSSGQDPQADRFADRAEPQLNDAWKRFEETELMQKKALTQRDYRAYWLQVIGPKFGKARISDISRAQVGKLHQSLSHTPYRANRVLALVSKLFSLCEAWEWREQGTNPCRYIKKFKEEPRMRYLSPVELSQLGKAMQKLVTEGGILPQHANVILLLLLTGARKSEILGLKWAWISEEQRVIFLPDSKTGKKPIFLSEPAIRVLEMQRKTVAEMNSEFVFPGRSPSRPLVNIGKAWTRIREQAELDDVRLHDLRHTAASIAVGKGVGLPVIGKLLGHSQAQTTARYAHVDTDPALAAANAIGEAVSLSFSK